MSRWLTAAALSLVVALACLARVEAKMTGLSPGGSLSPAEAAAKPSSKGAAAPAAKPTDDQKAAAEYKARQEAARLMREYARTQRTMTSRMRRKPSIDFESTSVKTILQYLAEVGRFSVVFDNALEEGGIDLETRVVSLKVSGITYEKAIELVLPSDCGYRVGPGFVLITTLEKSWMPLKTISYSIRLALATVPNHTDAPRFEIGDVTQSAVSAAGGGGFGDLFNQGGGQQDDQEKMTPERIIELVQKFITNQNDRRIAPWADDGGPATINYIGGQLIVSQTDHGHRAVRKFLAMIE